MTEIRIIDIRGYGTFVFRGDEDDCDHMCRGKASWEGSSGRHWLATDGLADPKLLEKTAKALLSAVKYPNGVADQSNYGPSPKKTLTPASTAGER